MTIYTTTGSELIDDIAWRHYGHQRGTAEAILAANPGLSGQPPILPPGLPITLPDMAAVTATQIPVKLYD
ncbi:MAG: tail protein X [Paracoccus sp. (in: a-proteobacteria)]|uniref:tail protein X n=1 Tax=Paracoccus sp. TaxID=267 RepID=UPI0026DFB316|nr:tail protein X [Paracoccus sp. (in: a-proteobacteria)]MDO5622239.1 tail protein X [Paracoccus sp. (in: a-proteobacteria)]